MTAAKSTLSPRETPATSRNHCYSSKPCSASWSRLISRDCPRTPRTTGRESRRSRSDSAEAPARSSSRRNRGSPRSDRPQGPGRRCRMRPGRDVGWSRIPLARGNFIAVVPVFRLPESSPNLAGVPTRIRFPSTPSRVVYHSRSVARSVLRLWEGIQTPSTASRYPVEEDCTHPRVPGLTPNAPSCGFSSASRHDARNLSVEHSM